MEYEWDIMIDQTNEATTTNKSAPPIPQLTDAPSDRVPLDPFPVDPPDPLFVDPAPVAVLVKELVTFPVADGVACGNLLMTLHEADADVEPEVYGR